MKISDRHLQEAITAYCVMLNRPQWLDDSRLLTQEIVWRRQIQRRPQPGIVTAADIEHAIDALLVDTPPHAIVPPVIFDYACRVAADRQRLADQTVIDHANGQLLTRQIHQLRLTGNLDEFDQAVARIQRCLLDADLPGVDVEAIMTRITDIAQDVAAWFRGELPGTELLQPAPADEDDDDAAETSTEMIHRWLAEGQT